MSRHFQCRCCETPQAKKTLRSERLFPVYAPDWSRTSGLNFRKVVLYPLSYGCVFGETTKGSIPADVRSVKGRTGGKLPPEASRPVQ